MLIKYIKSVLWRVAKCLSYIEEARCLKVKEMEPSATEQESSQQGKNSCNPGLLPLLETESAYIVPQGKTETVQKYRRRVYATIFVYMNTETKPPQHCASNGSDRLLNGQEYGRICGQPQSPSQRRKHGTRLYRISSLQRTASTKSV